MGAGIIDWLAEAAPDEIREIFRDMDTPWLVKEILDFFATHPATAVILVLGLALALFALAVAGQMRSRDYEQTLEDYTNSFPRRRWRQMGALDTASILEDAVAVFGLRQDKEGVAVHYGVLGLLYLQRGDELRAERMLTKALQLFEALGHREGIAVYAHYLSLLYREQRQFERSVTLAQRSLDMYRALGFGPGRGIPVRLQDAALQPQTDADAKRDDGTPSTPGHPPKEDDDTRSES